MKVLMYGWEFPPLISGGLGVACHAIVQELARKNLQVNLILPQTIVPEVNNPNINIMGCDLPQAEMEKLFPEGFCNIDIKRAGGLSLLNPYLNESEYPSILAKFKRNNKLSADFVGNIDCSNVEFYLDTLAALQIPVLQLSVSGKYGANLLHEVFCYAMLAGSMAETFPHDVIHAHDWLTVLAGVEAKKRSKKPLIFHIHALEPDRSGMFVNQQIFEIEKYGMQQADRVVAVSNYTKNMIKEKYDIPEQKIAIIHNATYFAAANLGKKVKNSRQKSTKTILFVGRLAHQKGPEFFVEMAQKILAKRKDVHFVLAGTGGMMQELIERVAALRLGRYIHFTGFLDSKRIEKLYQLADVYVMSSVSEPFGLSCLEAISNQVPAVISKQSGVSEVLTQPLKVDFWDTDEMANKILSLLDHHALRKEFMYHATQDLKNLTWDKTADSIINLYRQLQLDGRG